MKKIYTTPAVIDYGSIAECTFATPAVRNANPTMVFTPVQPNGSQYYCASEAGLYAGQGGKNYIVLQCDKFGEFSHS